MPEIQPANKRPDTPSETQRSEHLFKGLIFAAVIVLSIIWFFSPEQKSTQTSYVTEQKQIIRQGSAKRNLGLLSMTIGTQKQASHLLQLIEDEQKKIDYQITYSTDTDVVVFGCNFDKNMIIKTHNQAGGHGTAETWRGHIISRLTSAYNGGSLNQTPSGTITGTFHKF